MSTRAGKAHRILEVQRQLHRIEEWKLSDLQHRLAELERSQQELIGSLNGESALHDLFIDALARRLRKVAEETSRTGQARDAQAGRVAERAAQVTCAERLSERRDRQDAREEDKAQLLDMLERHASLRQD
jgi:hypothetical protein